MDNFDNFMKGLNSNNPGGNPQMEVDDELAALEREIAGNKKGKKKVRKNSDDLSLSDLSDDDEDEEEEETNKNKKTKKVSSGTGIDNDKQDKDDLSDFLDKKEPEKKVQPQASNSTNKDAKQSTAPKVDAKIQPATNCQTNQYKPPQNPYMAPQNQYKPPQNQYMAPQNQYMASQNQYMPPQNQYMPPQNQYMPPQNQYMASQNQYMPPQNQYMPPQSKVDANKNISPQPKTNIIDIYSELTEKIYHHCDKMKCISVLQNELLVCDKIIKFKKENGFNNYTNWENKKNMVNSNITIITGSVKNGTLDVDAYKKLIQSESDFVQKLLNFTKKDTKIQSYELNELTARLQARIKLIEGELKEEIEDVKETAPPTENIKKEQNIEKLPKQEEPKKEIPTKQDPEKEEEKQKKEEIKQKQNKEEITTIKKEPKKIEPKINITIKQEPKKEAEEKESKKEPIKKTNINEKLLQKVNDRLAEYMEAIDYFKANNLDSQKEDAIKKAKLIIPMQKLIEEGKDKKVNEFNLPNDITPEYICGYSNNEKEKKYKEIFDHYLQQINDIKKQINEIIDKSKLLSKSDQNKLNDKINKDLNDLKNRKERIEKIHQTLKENSNNPWRPAPLYSLVNEEQKTEIINKDIPENTVVICLGKTDYDKDHIVANLVLESKNEQVTPKTIDNYDSKSVLTFDKKEYKYLHKKTLEIQIFRKHWYKTDLKGSVQIKMDGLKSKSEIKGDFEIQLESKRCIPKLEVTINLRTPFIDKEYNVTNKQVFQVTKILPPFRGEGIVQKEKQPVNKEIAVLQPNKQNQETKISDKSQIVNKTKDNSNSQKTNNIVPKENNIKVDKSQFSEEELKNPDYIDNLNTMEVLKFKETEIEEKIKKIEGRTPKPIRDQQVKIRCKKKILEDQLGEEALTPEAYLEIIKKQHQHDKLLFTYFQQENDKEKAAIVAPRINLLIKEMEELIQYMKENA